MNQNLWRSLEKIRGIEFKDAEELANQLKRDDVHVAAEDMSAVSKFLSLRLRRQLGVHFIPQWLAVAIASLSQQAGGETVCDPCAGVGTVIAGIRCAIQAKKAVAYHPCIGTRASSRSRTTSTRTKAVHKQR